MGGNLRKSGIEVLGNVPWGTHFCQFYQTKEDLTDILIPYFKTGLENNEFCFWVTSQTLEVEEAKEALRKAVPDIDVYLEKGQIEIIPYTQGYVNEGVFDSEKVINGWGKKLGQVLSSGYEGLRVAGASSWLKKEDREDFVDPEKKVAGNIGKRQVISLCPYSLDRCSAADIIDVAFNHQFSLIKREGKWERIENFGRKNATKQKQAEEEVPLSSEPRTGLKLKSIPSPAWDKGNMELSEIIDFKAAQSLMDDFYKLVHIPIGLNDLKGNVLVGVGWQDICTKFHRVHPEACKHCGENNIKLSTGVVPGEFKMYRCKNNMWDILTPIMVGDQHIGYIFAGQFIFEDEPLDYELFRSQARQYGFNEEEYIAALEKVPRLSRETVDSGMGFFMTFANMLSQLSYSNIKLARSLAEREVLVDALRESEKRERARSDELAVVLDAVPAAVWVAQDPLALKVTGNRLSYEWIRIPEGANSSKSAPEGEKSETFRVFKDGVEIPPADMPVQMSAAGIEINDYEFDLIYPEGAVRHVLGHAIPLHDEQGNPHGSVSAFIDITDRKKAEEALKKAHDNLEKKVKARTSELEEAYKSLEKSEKGLAEAQKIAHIGNWDWNIITNKLYLSDQVYRIYGCEPQEFSVTRNVFLSYVHPDDRDYVDSYFNKSLNEKPISIDYRIILANKEERVIHAQGEVIFNEENIPVRTIGTLQDITERIKSEEKNQILANIVESSNDAIGTISLEGIITSWNKGAEQVYGYLAEEILGKPISILVPSHLEKEPQKLNELIKKRAGIPRYETLRLRKDGKIIYVSITLSPVFDIHGKLAAISFISRDITESRRSEEKLRESEEKYRNIVETANEGILITDNGAIITYANKKLADMLGCTLEEVIGRPIWGFINEEYKPIVQLNLEKRRQGISESYELKLICKDGSSFWTFLNAKPLFDEDGMFIGVMNMLTDIDKRKRAEEALVKIEIARKKEIHHRIKNNLQVISSLLDLQAEKFRDKEVLEAFRESQNRVLSMSLIHEELHKGEGTDTVSFSAYLQKLAENLFKTYSLFSKNIHLDMDLEENILFNMDTAVPLGIIVNELISNSLKHAFTEDKEGEIRIRLCREEKDNEVNKSLFNLTISDNGKGIPENVALESVESLGLQLVSILVDQLDGKIEIKRDQGTESRITFQVTEKS